MDIEYIDINILIKELQPLPEVILLTSRHAAPALISLQELSRDIPVFCVGSATAATVRAAGFNHVISGDSDASALISFITQQCQPGANILYLAGEDIRIDIGFLLNAQQMKCRKFITYKAVSRNILDWSLVESLKKETVKGVVFFSPRSAQIANALLAEAFTKGTLSDASIRQLDAYCLSLAVAEAAGALPWQSLKTCARPTTQAMVDLLVSTSHQAML